MFQGTRSLKLMVKDLFVWHIISAKPQELLSWNSIENRANLCSWYCTGTSCSSGLMSFALEKTCRTSFRCKPISRIQKRSLEWIQVIHQTYWENASHKCASFHCTADLSLAVNWPVLRQSQWRNFCSHIISSLINWLHCSRNFQQRVKWSLVFSQLLGLSSLLSCSLLPGRFHS